MRHMPTGARATSPTAYIVKTFPRAQHLSISLDGSVNADVLNLEEYAASPATYRPGTRKLQSGQLNLGSNALTAISVPPGTAHHRAFGIDNGVANQQPPALRVATYDTDWVHHSDHRRRTKGLRTLAFRNPAKSGVVSVVRTDAGSLRSPRAVPAIPRRSA